jgi:DNA primase
MDTLQQTSAPRIPEVAPERKRERYSVRKGLEVLKTAIPIEQVAAEYGEFKLLGNGRLLGRCVSQLHEDKTPSMTVYTDTGRFKCFGCGIWGDVIDLEVYGGYHADLWTAMIALSMRYNVELPARPERWHKHNAEKYEDRERIARVLTESYQRRLHRIYAPVILDGIEDHHERLEESTRLWEGFRRVARGMALRRMAGSS